jgi:hypothetical protein
MSEHMSRNAVFLSTTGGQIDFVRDGEVLASVAIPAGRVSAAEYLDLCPEGAELEISHGLAVMEPRRQVRSGTQHYGAVSYESGANPDFQPTSASRMENQLRLEMRKLQAESSRVSAMVKALQSIEAIPSPVVAPAPAPAASEGEGVVVE